MIRSRSPRSISSAVSFVAERIRIASKSPIRSASSSAVQSKPVSTSKCSRSSASPGSPTSSRTSTRALTPSTLQHVVDAGRSARARRRARPPGTSRRAAGCGRACGRARRRRSRSRAASRRAPRRRPRRRSRSSRRPASAAPGRRRTASPARGARPSRRGARRTRACAPTHQSRPPLREHPVELLGEQVERRDRRRVDGLVLAELRRSRRSARGTPGCSDRRPRSAAARSSAAGLSSASHRPPSEPKLFCGAK